MSGVVDVVDDERVNNFLFRLLRFKRMNTVKPMIKTSKIPPSIPATIELVFDVLLIRILEEIVVLDFIIWVVVLVVDTEKNGFFKYISMNKINIT